MFYALAFRFIVHAGLRYSTTTYSSDAGTWSEPITTYIELSRLLDSQCVCGEGTLLWVHVQKNTHKV
jgi:hypothetical protein